MNTSTNGFTGFTVVELLLVVVVIGIVAAMAISKFGDAKEQAYRDSMMNDLRNFVNAQEQYMQEHGQYADSDTTEGLLFNYTDDVLYDSLDVRGPSHLDGYYFRVAHARTDTKCDINYGLGLRNSIKCPGDGDGDGEGEGEDETVTPPDTTSTEEDETAPTAVISIDDEIVSASQEAMLSVESGGSIEASFAPVAKLLNQSIAFSGEASYDADSGDSITSYVWSFDGAGTENGKAISRTFDTPASGIVVNLRVYDTEGYYDDASVELNIIDGQPPVAVIDPRDGTTGLRALQYYRFDGTDSYDPDGLIQSYEWDWGDGEQTGNVSWVRHIYQEAGEYPITLTVADNHGLTDDTTIVVTVQGGGTDTLYTPTACIESSPADPVIGESVFLDGTCSTAGEGLALDDGDHWWEWYFADNWNYDLATSHAWDSNGEKIVSLLVCYDDPNSSNRYCDIAEDTIFVGIDIPNDSTLPQAYFSWNPTAATPGEAISFDGSASSTQCGTLTEYSWFFPDYSESTSEPEVGETLEAGTHPVSLRVKDSCGEWSQAFTRDVPVGEGVAMCPSGEPVPVADILVSAPSPTSPIIRFDASGSSASVTSVDWTFWADTFTPDTINGLTTNGLVAELSVPFDRTGMLYAQANVKDDGGCIGFTRLGLNLSVDRNNLSGEAPEVSLSYTPGHDRLPHGESWEGLQAWSYDVSPGIGVPLEFDASATTDADNNISHYIWDFGDGTVETTTSPFNSHMYGVDSNYNVKVLAEDSAGLVGVRNTTVEAFQVWRPDQMFQASWYRDDTNNFVADGTNYVPEADIPIDLSGLCNQPNDASRGSFLLDNYSPPRWGISKWSQYSNVHLEYDFGDGSPTYSGNIIGSPNVCNFTHTWDTDGEYTISVKATYVDQGGSLVPGTGSMGAWNITVLPAGSEVPISGGTHEIPQENLSNPVADFTYTCDESWNCQFTDQSDDPDGSVESWLWDFGDGGASTLQNPSHVFTPGTSYLVTLKVTDDLGKTGQVSIPVPQSEPVASFNATCDELECTFTDTSTDADNNITSRTWDFGDWEEGTGTSVTHTYSSSDTYTVVLTVQDADGNVSQSSQTMTVTATQPVASFTSECTDLTCSFDGTASNDPDGTLIEYTWDFGDGSGTVVAGDTTSHTYPVPGEYTVTLTVEDNSGAMDQTQETITAGQVGHQYWRIYVTANNGGAYTSLSEAWLMETPGGTDATSQLGSAMTAGTGICSSQYDSTNGCHRVWSNSYNDNWATSNGNAVPSWVGYDFGSNPVDIKEVMLRPHTNSGLENRSPRDFSIQYSDDGTTWSTAWSVTGETGWTVGVNKIFTKP